MTLRKVEILTCDQCGWESAVLSKEAPDRPTSGWMGWKEGLTAPNVYNKTAGPKLERVDWCCIECFVAWWRNHLTDRSARLVSPEFDMGKEEADDDTEDAGLHGSPS